MKKPPTAPPVYRPQLSAAQAKAASTARQHLNVPAALPPYRPQPLPKVLQTKTVAGHQPNGRQPISNASQKNAVAGLQPHGVLQQRKSPIPPQPYRPQPVAKVLQSQAPVAASMKRPTMRSSKAVQRQRGASLPQRNSPVPARQKVIQRYTLIDTPQFKGKMSEHGRYVTGQDLSEIYVLAGHNYNVERSRNTGRFKNIGGANYEIWEPELPVIGDCVAAMEEIMHGKELLYGYPRLSEYRDIGSNGKKIKGGKKAGKKPGKKPGKKRKAFGSSDEENRKFGKRADLGERADPGLLEGYVIARQADYQQDLNQFHGASVVAQDGYDDVTLEAAAPDLGPIPADRVLPVYKMYSREQGKGQSFKLAHVAKYGQDAYVSVVRKVEKLPKEALAPQNHGGKVIDYTP